MSAWILVLAVEFGGAPEPELSRDELTAALDTSTSSDSTSDRCSG